MSAVPTTSPLQARRHRLRGRVGDLGLHGLTLTAALACLVLVGAIVWKIVELADPSFDRFGFGFVTARTWDPVKHVFGALPFIYGTAVSSLVALVIATPLAIAIGLYLSELAPRGVRGIVGSLAELLAAVNRRLELVRDLKRYKEQHGIAFVDPSRETELLEERVRQNQGPISEAGVRAFFLELLALIKREV